MRRKRMYFMMAAILVAGCRQNGTEPKAVVFERTETAAALAEAADHIEVVPLETDPRILVGSKPELDVFQGDFVLCDKRNNRILRFAPDGSCIGPVGQKGNGPGEYVQILNVQAGEEYLIFSLPDKILLFGKDGSFVREERREGLGMQSCTVPEGILTYFGYGSVQPERAVLIQPDGTRRGYLPTEAKVINMMPDAPVFTRSGGIVYFTDSYTPAVYAYEGGEVREEVRFDFGKSALGEKFFQFDDAFAAAEYMLSAPHGFALIQRYLRNDRYQFLEVFVQKEMEVDACYGICREGNWKWFSLGEQDLSPFAGSVRTLDGNCLYCLLDAGLLAGPDHGLGGRLEPLRKLIANPEVLDAVRPDDNPVIAKVYLK